MAQNNNTRTLTAPLAVIKIGGYQSGFMRNVRITENIGRGEVQGISNLTLQEVPAVRYTCSLTCDFFFISLNRPEIQAFLKRDVGKENFLNTLILGEQPIQVHLYRKVKTTDSNGVITGVTNEGETIGVIEDFYVDSQSFDITENQVSGTNVSGRYLSPITFKE